jgi:hypothetical protein
MAKNEEFMQFLNTLNPRPTGVAYGEIRNAFMTAYNKEYDNSKKEPQAKIAAMEIYRQVYNGGKKKNNKKQKGGVSTHNCQCQRDSPDSPNFTCKCEKNSLSSPVQSPAPLTRGFQLAQQLQPAPVQSTSRNNIEDIATLLRTLNDLKKSDEETSITKNIKAIELLYNFGKEISDIHIKNIYSLFKLDKTIPDREILNNNLLIALRKHTKNILSLGDQQRFILIEPASRRGGNNKEEKITFEGGNYLVKTGPRGGKYIMHKGSKVYLTDKLLKEKSKKIPNFSL